VGQRDAAQPVGQTLQVVHPSGVRLEVHVGIAEQLVDDGLHHAVEQRLPAGDVPVQGHALHAEVRAEAAHGQLPEPLLVDEPHRGAENAPLVETRAAGIRSAGRRHRGGATPRLGCVLIDHRTLRPHCYRIRHACPDSVIRRIDRTPVRIPRTRRPMRASTCRFPFTP
jgi:hypothetical protein